MIKKQLEKIKNLSSEEGKDGKKKIENLVVLLIILIIALFIGVPLFVEYFKTGIVEKFPSLLFACFMVTISILLWITGIILQVIVKKEKQRYELYLNELEIIQKK